MVGDILAGGTKNYDTLGRRAMILLKGKILKSIVLRRTKKGRASELVLPPRIDACRWDTLDDIEQEFYKGLHEQSQIEFNKYVSDGIVTYYFVHIFSLLTKLRQAVDHPYLVVYPNTTEAPQCGICCHLVEDAVVASCGHSFCRICLDKHPEVTENIFCPSCSRGLAVDLANKSVEKRAKTSIEGFKESSILNRLDIQKFRSSTKIDALREEIMHMIECDSSAKGIVFSQFTSFLELINYSLKMSGIMCLQLVGSMSLPEREKAIFLFTENADYKILLVSLKGGGVALNLTIASHVFLMDPWWNPAMELQAQERIYRIGQHKPVRILRFVIEGTIEERMMKLQEKKIKNGIVGDMVQLTEADLKFLFQN